jgi:hypothetical protein
VVDVFSSICASGPFFLIFFIVDVAICFLVLFLDLMFYCFYYVVVVMVIVKYTWDDFSASLFLLFQIGLYYVLLIRYLIPETLCLRWLARIKRNYTVCGSRIPVDCVGH